MNYFIYLDITLALISTRPKIITSRTSDIVFSSSTGINSTKISVISPSVINSA